MAASALFILDLKGRVILSRDYRGDVSAKSIERFISKVSELEETGRELGNDNDQKPFSESVVVINDGAEASLLARYSALIPCPEPCFPKLHIKTLLVG